MMAMAMMDMMMCSCWMLEGPPTIAKRQRRMLKWMVFSEVQWRVELNVERRKGRGQLHKKGQRKRGGPRAEGHKAQKAQAGG